MSQQRDEMWNTAAIILGAVCLLFIALSEALGLTIPIVRNVLIAGFVLAGTIMWIVHSRKICPHCGTKVGLHFRILKSYECRNCGGDIREEPKT